MNLKTQRTDNTLLTSANWGRNSVLPSIAAGTTPSNPTEFYNDLKFLDWKLNSIRKNLTSYDFLRIMGTVTDPDTFNAMKTKLINNSALIINTSLLTDYKRGDIVYKDNFGEVNKINAPNVGLYYPSHIYYDPQDDNNVVTIKYTYSGNEVARGTTDEVDVQVENAVDLQGPNHDQAPEEIIFKNILTTEVTQSAYGMLYEFEQIESGIDENNDTYYWITFDAARTTKDNHVIRPDVRFYTSSMEEIILDDGCKILPQTIDDTVEEFTVELHFGGDEPDPQILAYILVK